MPEKVWRPYAEARAFARALGLIDQNEWFAYARGDLARRFGRRPQDIPFNPAREYRGQGWVGLRDWLGEPPLEPVVPGHLDFRRARAFARSLRLRSAGQWRVWARGGRVGLPPRPGNVPEDPAAVYPRAWRGWGDWLGTARNRAQRAPRFLPFDEARAAAREFGIANVKDWREFAKTSKPPEIPANPENAYRHAGWNGYGDWLGTDAESSRVCLHLPYEQAAAAARAAGVRSGSDYLAWVGGRRHDLPAPPVGVPACPYRTYDGAGWRSWGEFLGTGNEYRKAFPPFRRLRAFARKLGLRNHSAWTRYARGGFPALPRPPFPLPTCPDATYRGRGWTTWGDFLGTGFVATRRRSHRPFESARDFARRLGLRSYQEWRRYCAGEFPELPPLPADIPVSPDGRYRGGGWAGWPEFLGSRGGCRRARPFRAARAFARRLGLPSRAAWAAWLAGRLPDLPEPPYDLPLNAQSVYRDKGWAGWRDFLGNERRPAR